MIVFRILASLVAAGAYTVGLLAFGICRVLGIDTRGDGSADKPIGSDGSDPHAGGSA